jgi:integrase
MTTWKPQELRAFLEHVRNDRLFAAFLLLATTGMRRGEALGLRWEDVDLDEGWVSVTRSLISVGYDVKVSEPKTQRGRRRVALDSTTVAVLRDHRKSQLEERMAWGPAWRENGHVFAREDGSPIHPDAFSKLFNNRVRAAGVPRIRLHDLRHTHATLALQRGIHPKVVSERLGHASIAITLDTHSHAIPALEREAAELVATLVFGD